MTRVIHLVDSTTGDDAFSMLAMLLERARPDQQHHVLSLGHASLSEMLGAARGACSGGTSPPAGAAPPPPTRFVHSAGALDFTAWRAVRKVCYALEASVLHAWGVPGMLAVGMLPPTYGCLATLTTPLPRRQWNTVTALLTRQRRPMMLTINSKTLYHAAISQGVPAESVTYIPQGIAMKAVPDAARPTARRRLGLAPSAGPVIYLPPPHVPAARHDHGIWAAGILREILADTRVIVPPPTTRIDRGPGRHAWRRTQHFINHLSHVDMMVIPPPDFSYQDILAASDICLCAADGPISTGGILRAMAAGVPLVATAVECITEFAENQFNALLGPPDKPRALAARLEELVADPHLAPPLVDNARREIFMHHKPREMAERFYALYDQLAANPALRTIPGQDHLSEDKTAVATSIRSAE